MRPNATDGVLRGLSACVPKFVVLSFTHSKVGKRSQNVQKVVIVAQGH